MESFNPNSWGTWGVEKTRVDTHASDVNPAENFGNGGLGHGSDYGQGEADFVRAHEEQEARRRAMLEQASRPLSALMARQVEVG